MRNEAKLKRKIHQKIKVSNYVGTPLGDRLVGIAMMHTTNLLPECAEKLIPLFIGAFLTGCRFEQEEMENLGSVTPSVKKIKSIMIEEILDIILTETKEMTGKPLFMMYDNGDCGGKRRGTSSMKLSAR